MEPPGPALRALPRVSAKVPLSPEDVHLVHLAKDSAAAAAAAATQEPPPIVACITTYNESHEELQVSFSMCDGGGGDWCEPGAKTMESLHRVNGGAFCCGCGVLLQQHR